MACGTLCTVGDRSKPLLVAVVAGVLLLVGPSGMGPVIVIAAALLAGWLLPREPMTAAVLFLVPTFAVGAIRLLVDDDGLSTGALAFGAVSAIFLVAILTHVGAGVALRRRPESKRR